MDPEVLKTFIGEKMSSQLVRDMATFGLAALIHSSRVKKEIRAQFSHLTEAINSLGQALRQDLKSHSERIEKVEKGQNELRDRVNKMEYRGENGNG